MNTARIPATIALLGATLVLGSCLGTRAARDDGETARSVLGSDGSGTECFALYAGQTLEAGSVCVTVDGDDLEVTFETDGGWVLLQAKMWVGDDLEDLPDNRGGPIPGKFPYHSDEWDAGDGTTSYTFEVPLDDLGYSCDLGDVVYYLAAHADLALDDGEGGWQTETGWSDGDDHDGKNWATISSFTLTCDEDDDDTDGDGCESAFAYLDGYSTCFLEDGFTRWGWTLGPLETGDYEADLWAGAGQCDRDKGTHVGTVAITFDGFEAVVKYTASSGGFDATHVHAGWVPYPTGTKGSTVAPGQYGSVHDELEGASTDSHEVTVLAEELYVIAHAEWCE